MGAWPITFGSIEQDYFLAAINMTTERHSLYWDDFERRQIETVDALQHNTLPPIRRIAVFITERCNLRCAYCNWAQGGTVMTEGIFDNIVKTHGSHAIIHITGGEPSTVPWLYPYLRAHSTAARFHLNTNAVRLPPAKAVRRLKISLDSCDPAYWGALVGKPVWHTVVDNIQACIPHTVCSITCTMQHENLPTLPQFIRFCQQAFKGLYALFFSVYKGANPRFVLTADDRILFTNKIHPAMCDLLDPESKALLQETITEKHRLIQGVRFPENQGGTCYLSLSERVYQPNGGMSACSHLLRDGVVVPPGCKHAKCLYGCNRRLCAFNTAVTQALGVNP